MADMALIVVGASLGGLNAVKAILRGLPPEFPLPLAIVIHRDANTKTRLSTHLQQYCALPVSEPEDKEAIAPGQVYLAPSGYHLLVDEGHFALSTDEPVLQARPSIDALFESASEAYGAGVIGVVLTGSSKDGTSSAAAIKKRGGYLVVQDPSTAESNILPGAVINLVKPDQVLPVNEIAPLLVNLCCVQRKSKHV